MKNPIRLCFFWAFPIALGLCLFSLTISMRVEVSAIAGKILETTTNSGGFDTEYFLWAVEDSRYAKLNGNLYWSQVVYIILLMIIGALLTPRTLRRNRVADCATAITLGILSSKIVMGYPFFDWKEVFFWGAIGVVCFFLVFAMCSHQVKK